MNDKQQLPILITFEDLPLAEKSQAATELRELLLDEAEGNLDITLRKEDESTQDLGTILEIIIRSGAVVAVARGLQAFIARGGHRVAITTATGEVILTGDAAKNADVDKIIAALAKFEAKPKS